MLIHSLLTGAATLLALAALVVALVKRPARGIRQLQFAVVDLDARMDTLDGRWKKLNANYALLLAREKRHPGDEPDEPDDDVLRQRPGETGQEWKDRVRKAMRSGKVNLRHTN